MKLNIISWKLGNIGKYIKQNNKYIMGNDDNNCILYHIYVMYKYEYYTYNNGWSDLKYVSGRACRMNILLRVKTFFLTNWIISY